MKRSNIIQIYSKNRADKLRKARQLKDERNCAGEPDFMLRLHQREDDRSKKRMAKINREVDLRASWMEPFFKGNNASSDLVKPDPEVDFSNQLQTKID